MHINLYGGAFAETFKDICNAIREKFGTKDTWMPKDIPDAIRAIAGNKEVENTHITFEDDPCFLLELFPVEPNTNIKSKLANYEQSGYPLYSLPLHCSIGLYRESHTVKKSNGRYARATSCSLKLIPFIGYEGGGVFRSYDGKTHTYKLSATPCSPTEKVKNGWADCKQLDAYFYNKWVSEDSEENEKIDFHRYGGYLHVTEMLGGTSVIGGGWGWQGDSYYTISKNSRLEGYWNDLCTRIGHQYGMATWSSKAFVKNKHLKIFRMANLKLVRANKYNGELDDYLPILNECPELEEIYLPKLEGVYEIANDSPLLKGISLPSLTHIERPISHDTYAGKCKYFLFPKLPTFPYTSSNTNADAGAGDTGTDEDSDSFNWHTDGYAKDLLVNATQLTDLPKEKSETGVAFTSTSTDDYVKVDGTKYKDLWIKWTIYQPDTNSRWRVYWGDRDNNAIGLCSSWYYNSRMTLFFNNREIYNVTSTLPRIVTGLHKIVMNVRANGISVWYDKKQIFEVAKSIDLSKSTGICFQSDNSSYLFSDVQVSTDSLLDFDDTVDFHTDGYLSDLNIDGVQKTNLPAEQSSTGVGFVNAGGSKKWNKGFELVTSNLIVEWDLYQPNTQNSWYVWWKNLNDASTGLNTNNPTNLRVRVDGNVVGSSIAPNGGTLIGLHHYKMYVNSSGISVEMDGNELFTYTGSTPKLDGTGLYFVSDDDDFIFSNITIHAPAKFNSASSIRDYGDTEYKKNHQNNRGWLYLYNAPNMEQIDFSSVEEIKADAFWDLPNLKDINLAKLKTCNYGILFSCGIEEINLPELETAYRLLYDCPNLKYAILPKLKTCKTALNKCTSLEYADLGDVPVFYEMPCRGSTNLKTMVLHSNTVVKITTLSKLSEKQFNSLINDSFVLRVPEHLVNAYKADKLWKVMGDRIKAFGGA